MINTGKTCDDGGLDVLSYASALLPYDQGLMSQLSFVYNYFSCRSSHI